MPTRQESVVPNLDTTYQVNEIFHTIQGEGAMQGAPATFIRLQGCTVGCPWCDTKYTWKAGGKRMTVRQILEAIGKEIRPLIVITGGEPTLYDLDDLMLALADYAGLFYSSHTIQLETSGQNAFKGKYVPNWVTWSPKPNLHYATEIPPQLIHEIKFVVDDDLTVDIIAQVVDSYRDVAKMDVPVILMPEGCPPSPEHIQKTMSFLDHFNKHGKSNYYFGDRLQYRLGVK